MSNARPDPSLPDMKKCKFCRAIAATLGLILIALVSRFLVDGSVETCPDGRGEIVAIPAEKLDGVAVADKSC